MAELIQFDSDSGARIGRAVRFVEEQYPRAKPLAFEAIFQSPVRRSFRICTFTGSWATGSLKVVTFKNQTSTPNTVSAMNLFWPIPNGPQRDCSIAREGTSWYLLVPSLYSADAVTAATVTTASLEFKTLPVVALATSGTSTFSIAINTIDAVTSASLTTDGLVLTRSRAGVFFAGTQSSVTISVTTCDTATATP